MLFLRVSSGSEESTDLSKRLRNDIQIGEQFLNDLATIRILSNYFTVTGNIKLLLYKFKNEKNTDEISISDKIKFMNEYLLRRVSGSKKILNHNECNDLKKAFASITISLFMMDDLNYDKYKKIINDMLFSLKLHEVKVEANTFNLNWYLLEGILSNYKLETISQISNISFNLFQKTKLEEFRKIIFFAGRLITEEERKSFFNQSTQYFLYSRYPSQSYVVRSVMMNSFRAAINYDDDNLYFFGSRLLRSVDLSNMKKRFVREHFFLKWRSFLIKDSLAVLKNPDINIYTKIYTLKVNSFKYISSYLYSFLVFVELYLFIYFIVLVRLCFPKDRSYGSICLKKHNKIIIKIKIYLKMFCKELLTLFVKFTTFFVKKLDPKYTFLRYLFVVFLVYYLGEIFNYSLDSFDDFVEVKSYY